MNVAVMALTGDRERKMGFSLGDVKIDGTAHLAVEKANFDFQNLLTLHATFNPYTFAAGLLLDIWSAHSTRKAHEEQLAVLNAISRKLDRLNQTASAILEAIDTLPERLGAVFSAELLNDDLREQWTTLETYNARFIADSNLKIDSSQWNEICYAFNFLCSYEHRLSRLAAIQKQAEFLALLTAGTEENFVKTVLDKVCERVETIQKQLAESLIEETKQVLTACIDTPVNNWNPRFFNLSTVSNYREMEKLTDLEVSLAIKKSGGATPVRSWVHASLARDSMQAQINTTVSKYKTNVNDVFEAFNTYTALRKEYISLLEFDFTTALSDATNHLVVP